MIFRFADCELDTDRLELHRAGNRVDLEPQVFSVLAYLLENRDRVITREDLIDAIWSGRPVTDGALTTRINAARKAVGDDGKSQAVIRTLPRRGFRFVARVDEQIKATGDATGASKLKLPTLIVLPFKDLSGDRAQEFFADGLTEDLLTGISRLSCLRVIARHSSFVYKDAAELDAQVADELNIDYALQGSFRRSGSRVRITARLVQARTGELVWADRFESTVDDVFDLQDRINERIISELSIQLTQEDQSRLISRYTSSTAAREYFMRARIRYRMPGPEPNADARQLLDQALALDPDMSWAYAVRSFVRFHAWFFKWVQDDDALESALADADLAVSLDSGLAAAHSYFGWLNMWGRGHDIAIEAHRRALEIDRNFAEGYIWYASTLVYSGKPEAATEPMRQALALDPHYPLYYRVNFANQSIHLGNYREAEKQLQMIREAVPDFPMTYVFLAMARGIAGDEAGAREAGIEIAKRIPGTNADELGERLPYADKAHWRRAVHALRLAGLG